MKTDRTNDSIQSYGFKCCDDFRHWWLLIGPLSQTLDIYWPSHTWPLDTRLHAPPASLSHLSNGSSNLLAAQARPSESPWLLPCSYSTPSVHQQIHWLYLQNISQSNLPPTSTPLPGPSQPSLLAETRGKPPQQPSCFCPCPCTPGSFQFIPQTTTFWNMSHLTLQTLASPLPPTIYQQP